MADDPEQPEWFNKIMSAEKSKAEPPVRVQPVVVPLEECRLCGGKGTRMMRIPPYWDENDLEERPCPDCDGTGLCEKAQRHNSEVRGGGPLSNDNTAERPRRPLH